MFIIIWLIVFLYAIRLKIINHPAFIFNVFFALFICVLAFLEVGLLKDGTIFLNPDEPWFSMEAQRPLQEILVNHKRYLAYILYSHSTYVLVGEWGFKIQSLPFALLSAMILYDASGKKNALWLFPIVFGYVYFLATLHMRDLMIICTSLYFALKVSRGGSKEIITWSAIAMLFFSVLRPEFSIMWFFIMIWLLACYWAKNKFFMIFVIPVILSFISFAFFSDVFVNIASYFYPERIKSYVDDRAVELDSIFYFNDNINALIRQLITPLPTSKISYMLNYGLATNLFFQEIFRMVLMSLFYIMSIALLFNLKKSYLLIKENRFLQVLFAIALINTYLYAIYRDGGGSSRNKLYPIIWVYVVFLNIYTFRISKYVEHQLQKKFYRLDTTS